MKSLFGKLFGGRKAAAVQGIPLASLSLDDGPIYAVGDVHGCRSHYRALEEAILADAAQFAQAPRVVLLGDMVDRGPETAAFLDDLLMPMRGGRRLAIRGNHEEMMLAFVADPLGNRDWLEMGGFETLRSYGLALDPHDLRGMSRRRAEQTIAAYLPQDHLDFLGRLPFGFVVTGNAQPFVLAHAGFDGARGIDGQAPETLVWGGVMPGPDDGLRLVHGHYIRTGIDLAAPAIGIDTGAYKTGTLTALRLAQGQEPQLMNNQPTWTSP